MRFSPKLISPIRVTEQVIVFFLSKMTEKKKDPPKPDPWGRIYRCGRVALGMGALDGNAFGQVALERGFIIIVAPSRVCFWTRGFGVKRLWPLYFW